MMENQVLNRKRLDELLPSSTYIEGDDYALRNIIPDELWVMVLQNLANPENYWRICAASSFLQQILSSQRTRILFEGVLPVLSSYLEHKEDVGVFPSSVHLRAVCRTWKIAVDKIFEAAATQWPDLELASYTPTQATIEGFRKTGLLYEKIGIPNSRNYFDFENHFKATHSFLNPVVSKHLVVGLMNAEVSYPLLNQFIVEYGTEVRHFSFSLNAVRNCPNSIARTFASALPYFRSLKALDLKLWGRQVYSNQEWNCALSANEFPRIPSLQLLVANKLPSPVLRAILRNNPQIKWLDCRSFQTDLRGWLDSGTSVPTLEKLSIRLDNKFVFNQLTDFGTNWPLTTLNITITLCSLNYVLEEVKKKFGSTLQQLRVSAHSNGFLSTAFDGFTQLRVLHLDTHCFPNILRLIFLTNTLEELYLRFNERKRIHLLKNVVVWILFPKLKSMFYQYKNSNSLVNWLMTREEWHRQYGSNEDISGLKKRGKDLVNKILNGSREENQGLLFEFVGKNLA